MSDELPREDAAAAEELDAQAAEDAAREAATAATAETVATAETTKPEPSEEPSAPAPEPVSLTPERRESARAVLAVVEAMLYASGKAVPVEKMAEAADLPKETIEDALVLLEEACAEAHRGVMLDRVAGGVRLVSRPEHDDCIRTLLGLDGRTKLSMAALETLAIIAYRQPITAPDIAELRGVSSASSLRTLLDRKLITTAGRKEVVGTPFLYKTTKEFLVHFGLGEIGELPKPEELEAMYGVEAPAVDDGQAELFSPEETDAIAADSGETESKPEGAAQGDATPGENTEESAAPDAAAAPEE